jgi:hypothetical protein
MGEAEGLAFTGNAKNAIGIKQMDKLYYEQYY